MQEGLRNQIASHRVGQEIQITGFLVPTMDGKWRLAEMPAAKSCCLSKEVVSVLLSDFTWEGSPPRRPIHLSGELTKTPEGLLLQNVEIISSSHSQIFLSDFFLFSLILIVAFIGFWIRKKFC